MSFERGILDMRCPYCHGKNLYLKRTWPTEVHGCRDCEAKIKYLRKCGMTDEKIKPLFKKGATP